MLLDTAAHTAAMPTNTTRATAPIPPRPNDKRAELITPEIAAEIWNHNNTNRPFKRKTAVAYADLMRRGAWHFNGESIQIAIDGEVLNGQHRLWAIMTTGLPQWCMVVRGLPKAVFSTIDQGVKRTPGDVLSINGEKYAHSLAAALRVIFVIHCRQWKDMNEKVQPDQLLAMLAEFPETRRWLARYRNRRGLRQLFDSSLVGVATLFAKKFGDEVVDAFIEAVASGEGLSKGDPAYELRARGISNKAGSSRIAHDVMTAFMIKTMSAHIAGKRIGVLRMLPNEAMPLI
jgi:hypothetical protein